MSSFFGNATSEKPTPSTPTPSISQDKPIPTPKTGVAFRKALENYGFDQLSPYIDDLEHQKKKVDKLADGVIAELAKVECKQCQRGFSNIWVLKVHCEEVRDLGEIQSILFRRIVEEFQKNPFKNLLES